MLDAALRDLLLDVVACHGCPRDLRDRAADLLEAEAVNLACMASYAHEDELRAAVEATRAGVRERVA